MQNIVKYFDKAGLSVSMTDRPIARNLDSGSASRIFQMTIDDIGKKERFRIFRGSGNDVRVLDYDQKKQQLLLFVKEPRRKFTETRYDTAKRKNIDILRETPEAIRRYLMGMDERHLFISELPDKQGKINKVEDAFKILKPYEVKDRKKRKKTKVHRQGEWFFIEATPEELLLIKDNELAVRLKDSIIATRLGKSHIAENILRINDYIFVKGKVTHADHKTKEFYTWHRVFRNREKIDNFRSNVYNWID